MGVGRGWREMQMTQNPQEGLCGLTLWVLLWGHSSPAGGSIPWGHMGQAGGGLQVRHQGETLPPLPGRSRSVMGRRAKPAYGSPTPCLAPGPVSWGSREWREGQPRSTRCSGLAGGPAGQGGLSCPLWPKAWGDGQQRGPEMAPKGRCLLGQGHWELPGLVAEEVPRGGPAGSHGRVCWDEEVSEASGGAQAWALSALPIQLYPGPCCARGGGVGGEGCLPLPEPRPAESTVPESGTTSLGLSEARAGPGGRGAGAAGRR